MEHGHLPKDAAQLAIDTIANYYPDFSGAVIAVNIYGHYGAACHGFDKFPYSIANSKQNNVSILYITCTKSKS
jgi:N4-(beta-N-acetylglucosaminyl)-L-asparaginase